jgi:hypothetical protein
MNFFHFLYKKQTRLPFWDISVWFWKRTRRNGRFGPLRLTLGRSVAVFDIKMDVFDIKWGVFDRKWGYLDVKNGDFDIKMAILIWNHVNYTGIPHKTHKFLRKSLSNLPKTRSNLPKHAQIYRKITQIYQNTLKFTKKNLQKSARSRFFQPSGTRCFRPIRACGCPSGSIRGGWKCGKGAFWGVY